MSFLESIDLEEWKRTYSRQELKEFSKQLYNVKVRNLAYEISQLAEEMKKEEFPQLLGIHRFPVIHQIDLLTEREKIELDKYLGNFRKGQYVRGLWRVVKDSKKVHAIESFLINHGILQEMFVVLCPNCSDNHLSHWMTKEEKERFMKLLQQEKTWERSEELEKILQYVCDECDYSFDFDKVDEHSISFQTYLKLTVDRDRSLDDV